MSRAYHGIWAWLLVVAGSACAVPPLENPNVPATAGVVVGHVQVFSEGRDVTQECTVGLSDGGPLEVSVRPDPSGWIFAAFTRGKVRISSVDCGAKTFIGSLDFQVTGDGRTTYFGHVTLNLHPETTQVLSQNSAFAIEQGMKSVPHTITGTAVGTAVGLLAMLLLSDSVAAGPATVEVEDKTYEAAAAYTARYRQTPALVVSLAGSLFSSDPTVSPLLQKAGDVIYTEASLSGVRLTWLAVSNEGQGQAALRVQRPLRKEAPCESIKLIVDGRELVLPAISKTRRASAMLKQTVQGEIDSQAIREVATAKRVLVDVCGTKRAFSELARGATIHFANGYAAMRASPAGRRPDGSTPAVTSVAVPTSSQVALPAAISTAPAAAIHVAPAPPPVPTAQDGLH